MKLQIDHETIIKVRNFRNQKEEKVDHFGLPVRVKLEQEKYNTNTRLEMVNLDIEDELMKGMIINSISPPAPKIPPILEREVGERERENGEEAKKPSSGG